MLLLSACLIRQDVYEERLAYLQDTDGDGYKNVESGGDDCDDSDWTIHPDADEIARDDVDQDCDGADLRDGDGDGAGDDDCDDADADIYPGATEVPYDTVDQDCDGADLADVDGDGVDGAEAGGEDCDDADDAVYPGAADACYDGVDADCAGDDDDDCDGDGEAAEAAGGRDCDDGEGARGPDAPEGWHDRSVDNDCDGSIEDPVSLDLGAADATYTAPTGAGWFGYRVGAIDDLDGDGIEDIWVLAPYSSQAGAYAGAAYMIPSTYADGTLPDTTPHVSGTAGLILGAAGTSLDVGDDGEVDLLATSALADGDAGVVLGWEGERFAELAGEDARSTADLVITGGSATFFGVGLQHGDLDGDGADDLVVDADGSSTVHVFLGIRQGSYTGDDADVVLTSPGGQLQSNMLVDVDGDGLEDLGVSREGAPEGTVGAAIYSASGLTGGTFPSGSEVTFVGEGRIAASKREAGQTTLLLVSERATIFPGVTEGAWSPSEAPFHLALEGAVGAAAYTDWLASDGFGFILASEAAEGEAGAGWLWETDLWTSDAAVSDIQLGLRGEEPGDAAGSGFALVADRNGDGESDLLLGAPRNDAAGADAGRVYVQHAP